LYVEVKVVLWQNGRVDAIGMLVGVKKMDAEESGEYIEKAEL